MIPQTKPRLTTRNKLKYAAPEMLDDNDDVQNVWHNLDED